MLLAQCQLSVVSVVGVATVDLAAEVYFGQTTDFLFQ